MDMRDRRIALAGRFFQLNRKRAQARLHALGARCTRSVDETVDVLLAGEGAERDRARARSHGIPIYSERDLKAVWTEEWGFAELAGELSPRPLAEAIRAIDWRKESAEAIDRLTRALRAHEESHGITRAHRVAADALRAADRARLERNTPHETALTAWAVSRDGRYLATGSWGGDDDADSESGGGGQLAIWELHTGRCVNVVEGVPGGVGWPHHDVPGSLQWSPDDRRVGLIFDTNANGFVEIDWSGDGIPYRDDVTEGMDRPPGWCWAPDSKRQFISCLGYDDALLPGCISVPSPDPDPHSERAGPVYMAHAGHRGGVERLELLSAMVWRHDDVVVGTGDGAYAIDLRARTLRWSRNFGSAAVSPDGAVVVGTARGGRVVDGETGQELTGSPIPECDAYLWASAGPWFAGVRTRERSVRLYRIVEEQGDRHVDLRSEGAIPVAKAAWEFPDLKPLAVADDGARIAALTPHQTLEVWSMTEAPERVLSTRAAGFAGVFVGADRRIALASSERLRILDGDSGEPVADHTLFEGPAEDPELAGEDLTPFPARRGWGYYSSQIVIAKGRADRALQWVVDRRRAWPLAWANVSTYRTIRAAVKAEPEAFSEAMRARYAKPGKRAGKRGGLPFPLENQHGVHALFDYARACLAEQLESAPWESRMLLAELALQQIASGETTRALRQLEGIDFRGFPWLSAHVAAYLGRAGEHEPARDHARLAEADYERIHEWRQPKSGYRGLIWIGDTGRHHLSRKDLVSAMAWIGAANHALTGSDGGWLAASRDAIAGDEAPPYRRGHLRVAAAHGFAGQWDAALAIAFEDGSRAWWEDLSELASLLTETGDFELIGRFLSEGKPRQMTSDPELLTKLLSACAAAGHPEKSWEFRDEFTRMEPVLVRERILASIAACQGIRALRALIEPEFERRRREGATVEAAQALSAWAAHEPEAARERALSFFEGLTPEEAQDPFMREPLSKLLPRIGAFDYAIRYLRACGERRRWPWLLENLSPDHPHFSLALKEVLEMRVEEAAIALVHVRGHPKYYDDVADTIMTRAGHDDRALERLVAGFVRAGDFARAYAARMKCPRKSREQATEALARAAMEHGHVSCALAMLEECLHGHFGSGGREFEAVCGLVKYFGDEVWRASR